MLTSARLILRPASLADAREICAFLTADPTIAEMTRSIPTPCTDHAALQWFRGVLALPRTPFIIVERESGKAIGMMGLHDEPPVGEFGYWLGAAFRNRGYATEALKTVVLWAWTLGFTELTADTYVGNVASERVLINAGFSHAGTVERDVPQRGGLKQLNLWSLKFRQPIDVLS